MKTHVLHKLRSPGCSQGWALKGCCWVTHGLVPVAASVHGKYPKKTHLLHPVQLRPLCIAVNETYLSWQRGRELQVSQCKRQGCSRLGRAFLYCSLVGLWVFCGAGPIDPSWETGLEHITCHSKGREYCLLPAAFNMITGQPPTPAEDKPHQSNTAPSIKVT